jgi:mono/diheme cytochrome c family protein
MIGPALLAPLFQPVNGSGRIRLCRPESVAVIDKEGDVKHRAVMTGAWRVGLGIIMLGVWGWSAAAGAAEGAPQKGRPIYEKYCLLCHGPKGMGDGPQGQLMKPPAANFRSPESRNKSDAALMKIIREGHPDSAMTKWAGILSEADMQNVLAYIRQLSGGPDTGM